MLFLLLFIACFIIYYFKTDIIENINNNLKHYKLMLCEILINLFGLSVLFFKTLFKLENFGVSDFMPLSLYQPIGGIDEETAVQHLQPTLTEGLDAIQLTDPVSDLVGCNSPG